MSEPLKITCALGLWTKVAGPVQTGKLIMKTGFLSGRVMGDIRETEAVQTPDVGNTGDGTVTALAILIGGAPKTGIYNLECVTAVANGGIFKLVDPDAIEIQSAITIPPGAGNSITFSDDGITFILTDGAADFIVGDKFALEFFQPATIDETTAEPIFDSSIGLSHTNPANFYIKPKKKALDLVALV